MLTDQWAGLKEEVKNEAIALDGEIAEWLKTRATTGKRIFCAAGCSNCCTLFVQATLIEALLVAAEIDATQLYKLQDYVLRQRESLTGVSDLLSILRKQRQEIGPCPFLDNAGSCSVYAQRPLACRALLSTKPAEWCSVDFSTLDPLEKRLYLESLERPVVAFPVHYVATTQNSAQSVEARLLKQMEVRLGVAISGNFPLLVYLAYTTNLVSKIEVNTANWLQVLQSNPFFHPHLIQILPANRDNSAPP
ncbi:MAG: YkgJ family cysteine cluster protein [Desulfuromonadales bacterium]|nr:YkgJ family cysteine cluster protein [Desulfuromonadales bacterium]